MTTPSLRRSAVADVTDSSSDLAILRLGYKKMREWIRRMPLYRGELQRKHPVFPEGSAAECKEGGGPVPIDAPNIVYTTEDDKAIDDFHRMQGKAFILTHDMLPLI